MMPPERSIDQRLASGASMGEADRMDPMHENESSGGGALRPPRLVAQPPSRSQLIVHPLPPSAHAREQQIADATARASGTHVVGRRNRM